MINKVCLVYRCPMKKKKKESNPVFRGGKTLLLSLLGLKNTSIESAGS